MLPFQWADLHHFEPEEFNAPEQMQLSTLSKLDAARDVADIPFVVKNVKQFREGDDKSHGTGHGVDIEALTSQARYRIVSAAIAVGFNRIGIYDLHVHLDDWPAGPPQVIWIGLSR